MKVKSRTSECYKGLMMSPRLSGKRENPVVNITHTSPSHNRGNARTFPHGPSIQKLVSALCAWSWSAHSKETHLKDLWMSGNPPSSDNETIIEHITGTGYCCTRGLPPSVGGPFGPCNVGPNNLAQVARMHSRLWLFV